jgi:endonuclease/exonuclease/phosphatase family metal-dependent hydrolase
MRLLPTLMILLAGCGTLPHDGAIATAPPAAGCREPAGVEWRLPAADRGGLDRWCAAVGRAVLQPAPDAGAAIADSLLIVSWNVHVGGGDLVSFVRELRAGALTDGRPVEHFVLLLQEAHRDGRVPTARPGAAWAQRIAHDPPAGTRISVDSAAHGLGLHLVYVPSMGNGGDREDRGNALLATTPLAAPVALELPLARQRRVAVVATTGGLTRAGAPWSVQLASVHLENRAGLTGVQARAAQMQWLLAALPPAEVAVLGGDLNTWVAGEREGAFRLALGAFPGTPVQPPGGTYRSMRLLRARLDYIFGRAPGRGLSAYERVPSSYGSDHYPLRAWLHLAQPAGNPTP